ncbi:MAG: 3-phosphoserine/phosphohydroxythreonine transaminase [Pyrinomonadaceae bacterium MAG19_C2-C3]|nr:3-phosphoserine/phosphohydroxythreonine transaminase [Pyrinomonadaceae bacterium MAG19_C2-C3]
MSTPVTTSDASNLNFTKASERIYNFSAGPAVIPLPVLERAQAEMLALPGVGMSVMEISHRSKKFEEIIGSATSGVSRLLGLTDDYHVLFLQGGASLQFSQIPMNFLTEDKTADYIVTGSWGKKAVKEAKREGTINIAFTAQEEGFKRVPKAEDLKLDANSVYCHFTTNETIEGVQFQTEPDAGDVPLVADMSSDIMSRPIDVKKYGMIYAGAQKNLGPSGVTLVIVRDDMLKLVKDNLHTMLDYRTHVENKSLYNTPNTWGIYILDLVCQWVEGKGGLNGIQQQNEAKAKMIYDVIDANDFYRGHADVDSRSRMTPTFRLGSEDLEKQFVKEADAEGMNGLKGHRSVGGIRASIYNAFPVEGVKALTDFMQHFAQRNG